MKLFSLLKILLVVILLYTALVLKIWSNSELIFNQDGDLQIMTASGWIALKDTQPGVVFKKLYASDDVEVMTISLRRNNYKWIHKLKNRISQNKIHIFEFNKSNYFSVFADIKADFQPQTSKEVIRKGGFNFCVNTSFYDKNNAALGEVIIDGHRYGKINNKATGFFRVVDGNPFVGASGALFSKIKGEIEYSCQAFPSVIGNGYIWEYIENDNDSRHRESWKTKTYRNLIGMMPNGNIVCIVSAEGGLLSIKEIAEIGLKYGLAHATLFDGGTVLQYRFINNDFKLNFSVINNKLLFPPAWAQKSPVYLGIKLR